MVELLPRLLCLSLWIVTVSHSELWIAKVSLSELWIATVSLSAALLSKLLPSAFQ